MNLDDYKPSRPRGRSAEGPLDGYFICPVYIWAIVVALLCIFPSLPASSQELPAVEIEQPGPHHTTTVQAVGQPGRYIGFDVLADGKLVAPVRFTSRELITCPTAQARTAGGTATLSFDGLQAQEGCGLKLAKSRITVTLTSGKYPSVAFDLTLQTFSPERWQSAVGLQPFHFLTIGMGDATVWHQGGWLNAAPRADLFPLLLDTHEGTPELSSYPYNREWSKTPPLCANPLPVIGLWAPARGCYAGWDFQPARLQDNSERDIATGFCNRLVVPGDPNVHLPPEETLPPTDALKDGVKDPHAALSFEEQSRHDVDQKGWSKFVALVYPSGGTGYQQMAYPQAGAHLASQATFVYSTELASTDDPTRFLWQTWWDDEPLRQRLPRVPALDDLSWIGDAGHLRDLPGAPGGSLLAGVEGSFQIPGSRLIDGWGWHNESAVAAPAKRGDLKRLAELERDAETLVKYARRFSVDKQPCVYWEKPLVGQWTDPWGGPPVTTLHNANGWAAGRLLLDLARYAGKKEYLPLVDGVLNWTRNVVWTRNEFADVPSSPFAIGGTLATAFLLDYYFTFQADPDRRTRALEALDLARSFTYRYMVMWTADSRRDDALDSAFLWEPNSGRDWTGAACSNEVIWDLDTLAQVAVHTGDPILMWALQGSLSRWHQLYQDVYHDTLAEYRAEDFTEGYGLAPGNIYGYPGGRARYGFGGPLSMLEPVGDTTVRVLAGEKAAMAFDRAGSGMTLRDYRCTGIGDFAFTLRQLPGTAGARPEPPRAVDVTVTFPYADLSASPVFLLRDNITKIPLKPGERVIRDPNALWSLIVRGVRPGETVVVGSPDLAAAERLPVLPPLTQAAAPIDSAQIAPFVAARFPVSISLDDTWQRDGFAGLWGGLHWIDGVPFLLPDPPVIGAEKAVILRAPIPHARAVYLLYAPQAGAEGAARLPAPLLDDGTPAQPVVKAPALAWRAWPPVMTARLLLIGYTVPGDHALVGIDPAGQTVIGVTALPQGPEAGDHAAQIAESLGRGAAEWQALLAEDQLVGNLRALAASLPEQRVAILPPTHNSSPASDLLARGDLHKRMVELSPQQLVDPAQFDPQRYPFALYLDGEDYLDTVKSAGDASDAVARYVQQGGTLLLLAGQPYPMYYATEPDGRYSPRPLLPRLGLPLTNSIETEPVDVLMAERVEGETALPDAPRVFRYPQGDPRLRSVDRDHLPAGAVYTPIYRIYGGHGKDYGDAAALIELPAGADGKRGRILYVSNVLLRAPAYGPQLLQSVLRWMVKQELGVRD